jgi:hypothetical protein
MKSLDATNTLFSSGEDKQYMWQVYRLFEIYQDTATPGMKARAGMKQCSFALL